MSGFPKTIALYGGSFDPPHLGHISAAAAVARELSPDLIMVIPDNIPPHKELSSLSPSALQRLEMCRIAFADVPGAVVSDIELKRGGRSYTADTVRSVREMYPDSNLYIILGSDMFMRIDKWRGADYILSCCSPAVVSRENDDRASLDSKAQDLFAKFGVKSSILLAPSLPVSSTGIRDALSRGQESPMLSKGVFDYISARGLYRG